MAFDEKNINNKVQAHKQTSFCKGQIIEEVLGLPDKGVAVNCIGGSFAVKTKEAGLTSSVKERS